MLGSDLLTVESDQGPALYYQLVAERLRVDLNVTVERLRVDLNVPERLPLQFDLNDVICASEQFHGNPAALNSKVLRILKSFKPPPPKPLQLLAQIEPFRLFVSTTIDTLMEDALKMVRGQMPTVVAFPPASNLTDFDEELLGGNASMVFQILGRASPSSSFAVTEGQVLEQMHTFMAGDGRPKKLITKLHESHLLIIGVSFPDWLARFLLRLAREAPLWNDRTMMEVIVDGGHTSPAFGQFLRRFSPEKSRMFTSLAPVDFVNELHRRWFERHSKSETQGAPVPSTELPADMETGCIFISYASEDRHAAFNLANELTANNLEVWVDRRLNVGDDYNGKIARNIEKCCAFVAVLSSTTQKPEPRYFRQEWDKAIKQNANYTGIDEGFLFPVVIDSTPLDSQLKSPFQRTALSALNGKPPPALVTLLEQAQRNRRKQAANR